MPQASNDPWKVCVLINPWIINSIALKMATQIGKKKALMMVDTISGLPSAIRPILIMPPMETTLPRIKALIRPNPNSP